MLTTIAFVVFSILALSMFALSLRGAAPPTVSIQTLEVRLRDIDLQAFQNLTSTNETAYLHDALSPAIFRRVHRQRVGAAIRYLRELSVNAKILMQIGDLARRDRNSSLASVGQELAETALRTRLLIFTATFRLASQYIFPKLTAAPTRQLFLDYSELNRRFERLSAARAPRANEYSLRT